MKEAPASHPMWPALDKAQALSQEMLRRIVGTEPMVSGEAMLTLTLVAMTLPVVFRTYRAEIFKEDKVALEFHEKLEREMAIVAWPTEEGAAARAKLFIGSPDGKA